MRKIKQTIWFMQALLAARTVQDFLLGTADIRNQPWEIWVQTLEKRITKMRQIDHTSTRWKIEARKRLLQVAAVSIAMIEWVDAGGK